MRGNRQEARRSKRRKPRSARGFPMGPANGAGWGSVATQPVVDIPLRFILRLAVALLNAAGELGALSLDDIQIVIRKLAPLLLDLALELLPISFDLIPVHSIVLSVAWRRQRLWKNNALWQAGFPVSAGRRKPKRKRPPDCSGGLPVLTKREDDQSLVVCFFSAAPR